jgi:hypothetical protein
MMIKEERGSVYAWMDGEWMTQHDWTMHHHHPVLTYVHMLAPFLFFIMQSSQPFSISSLKYTHTHTGMERPPRNHREDLQV